MQLHGALHKGGQRGLHPETRSGHGAAVDLHQTRSATSRACGMWKLAAWNMLEKGDVCTACAAGPRGVSQRSSGGLAARAWGRAWSSSGKKMAVLTT